MALGDLNLVVSAQVSGATQGLKQVDQSLQRVQSSMARANSATKGMTNQFNSARTATQKWATGALQQAGYQIGDFAVQVANGTSKMQAFGQQGSQLLGIFGPFGAVLGAGVAIVSAFAVAAQRSGAMVKSFKEELEDSNGALEEYISLASSVSAASSDMFKNLKGFAEQSSTVINDLIAIEKIKAFESILKLNESLFATVSASGFFNVSVNENITRLLGIGNTSIKTREAIRELERSFIDLRRAGDLETSYEAATRLRDQMLALVDPINTSNAELRTFYQQLLQSIQTMELLGAVTKSSIAEESVLKRSIAAYREYHASRVAAAYMATRQEIIENRKAQGEQLRLMGESQAQSLQILNNRMRAWQQYYQSLSTSAAMAARQEVIETRKAHGEQLRLMGESQAQSLQILNNRMRAWQQYYRSLSTSAAMAARQEIIENREAHGEQLRLMGESQAQSLRILNTRMTAWKQYYQSRILGERMVAAETEAYAKVVGRGRGGDPRQFTYLDEFRDQLNGVNNSVIDVTENLAKIAEPADTALSSLDKMFASLDDITNSVSKTMENAMTDAFMSIVDGTQKPIEAFKNMARLIIAELYKVLVVKQLVGSFDTANPSAATGIVGFLGKAFGGFMANGGPVSGGTPYIVGERGPELFVPSRSGTIVPNGAGGGVTVNQNISFGAGVSRAEINAMMPKIVEVTKAAVMDAKRRGGSYGRAMA